MSSLPQKSSKKLRIRLKAYDSRVIDKTAKEIVEAAKSTGAVVAGPFPLPTRIERFTVLRSPHVDRKSRDQFESRTCSRVIEIEVTPQTAERLKKLVIASGVEISTKTI
jgi:small subunit ribosomal protein S10